MPVCGNMILCRPPKFTIHRPISLSRPYRRNASNKDQISFLDALIANGWNRFRAYGAKVNGLINRIINLPDEDSEECEESEG